MKAKKIYSITISFIVLGTIIGILYNNKSQLNEKIELSLKENSSIPISVSKPQYVLEVNDVRVTGRIVSDNEVSIVSRAHGVIIERYKKVGEYLAKGSIIARVEDEVINKKLQLAKQNLAKAEKDVKRYSSLLTVGAVTKTEVENVELSMRTAESTVIELEEQLKNTFIIAPISGIFEKDYFEVGTFVAPNSVVGEMIDPKKLKAYAIIAGKDIVKISKHCPAIIEIDVYPNRKFEGKVNLISSKGDESMTYIIEIIFTYDYSSLLKPGMHAQIHMNEHSSNKENVLTIERQCIIGSLKEPRVYIVENGKAYIRDISIGQVINDRIEVISGLKLDDIIVNRGQINLTNGCAVTIY